MRRRFQAQIIIYNCSERASGFPLTQIEAIRPNEQKAWINVNCPQLVQSVNAMTCDSIISPVLHRIKHGFSVVELVHKQLQTYDSSLI